MGREEWPPTLEDREPDKAHCSFSKIFTGIVTDIFRSSEGLSIVIREYLNTCISFIISFHHDPLKSSD